MANTTYEDVLKSFHTTFQDKVIIPESLELEWFKKAVGKYSFEIETLNYDEVLMQFNKQIDRYVVDTLGSMMKKFYQERELSKVNKRISIVGKDLSIDGSNGSKTATKNELEYVSAELDKMIYNQTPSAYN
jgi:hypothetical protein